MSKSYRVTAVALVAIAVFTGLAWGQSVANPGFPATGWPPADPPTILDHGGPDAGGYYYIDSQDTAFNAPVYQWKEISSYGVNMNMSGDDVNLGPFLIGFTFRFYGIDFLTFRVCSNGFASFTSANTNYVNASIPTSAEPNNLLAAYWEDLATDANSRAYYYTNNADTLIIEWYDFIYLNGSGRATFQAILTSDGNILYQYNSLTGTTNSHTIGIENQAGTVGLQYIYNTARNETGTAILFTRTAPDFGTHDIVVVAADVVGDYTGLIDAYPDIQTATYYDARSATPTLSYLQGFDAAVVYSNFAFLDPVGMGNVLADYLDAGGAVVVLQGSFATGWAMQGRLMTDYSPLTVGSLFGSVRNMGTRDVGHPIMVNIDSLTERFSSTVTTQHSAYLVASYTDGTPLVAYNPVNNLVGINGFVGNNHQYTGDIIELTHNAINFAIEGPAPVLLVISDPYSTSTAIRRLKQFSDIPAVDVYNAAIASPSLALLNLYEVALVWSNSRFSDAQVLGNRLADYADGGGGVVLHQFSFANSFAMRGRLMSSYCPFDSGATQYQHRTLGQHNEGHFLMAGVNDVTNEYTANVTVVHGGVNVASWDDSSPFVAYNPVDSIVAINGYIGGAGGWGGDMFILIHNAINFARGHVSGIDEKPAVPASFELAQNYPNPFNPATTIAFNLSSKCNVTIDVFNVLGQRVTTLPQGNLEAGRHAIAFDASGLGSGVYFYRLSAGDKTMTKKMVVLK